MSNKPNNVSFAKTPLFWNTLYITYNNYLWWGRTKNLSVITFGCEHYWGQKKQNMGKTGIHGSSPCFYFLCCPKITPKKNFHKDLCKDAMVKYYLMNIIFKFHKDPSLRWGDIAILVTLYNLEVKMLGSFHPELLPKVEKLFWLFGTPSVR